MSFKDLIYDPGQHSEFAVYLSYFGHFPIGSILFALTQATLDKILKIYFLKGPPIVWGHFFSRYYILFFKS